MRWSHRYLLVLIAGFTTTGLVRAEDWPQWLGPKRDGVWRETGIVQQLPAGGPKVRWRTPIGEGYSGPAVANGKVYITDRVLAKGAKNPDNAFDRKSRVNGIERILCLNEADGKILWQHDYASIYQISYASGPRTTPVVAGGKVYTVGAMGDLYCLDADSGAVVWSNKLLETYKSGAPVWGVSGSPLVDGDLLICLVGGQGSVAVAFDKNTGKEVWKALSANEPGYAPPMIYEIGGKRQLILWHPESINSLDPATGKLYWSHKYNKKKALQAGMSIPTPRQDGDLLFFTCFYEGAVMLKTNGTQAPAVLWQKAGRSVMPEDTDGLHSVMVTPVIQGDHIYGVCSYGELRCLDKKTGERIWSTHKPVTGKSTRWGNAFIVGHGDRYFLFNELGDLIIAKFSPKGYEEISRANILAPTNTMAPPAGRRVIWSHPAFANRAVYARNDKEIICVSLAE
ncbi:MAG: pyrrolo-quinoline quinone [Gemmataceae bacterium]|nr:pyrrolo-quinoline quinone [Gemmataceae bacterium]